MYTVFCTRVYKCLYEEGLQVADTHVDNHEHVLTDVEETACAS